jgi:hypothetical protein
MIWAKIVENEIMQTFDEDVSKYWHPDAIAQNELAGHWQEVPDHVNVGWKWKNDQWISGGQWLEEWIAANPPPPPGPPSLTISANIHEDLPNDRATLIVDQTHAGEFTDWSITVDGTTYTKDTVDAANKGQPDFQLEYVLTDAPQPVSITGTLIGPGGTVTVTLDGEDAVILPEKFVPFFLRK